MSAGGQSVATTTPVAGVSSGTQQAPARQSSTFVISEELLRRILLILVALFLAIGVVAPLIPLVSRSLHDSDGAWVGLQNYVEYFTSPNLASSFGNSLFIASVSTVAAIGLAFGYSFALTRTMVPGKGFFRAVALLPLFVPPLALGIGLVYLFGNKGLVTTGLLGWAERTIGWGGWDIGLYGPVGIILGEFLYCFPQAFLLLAVGFALADARLYEASAVLGASAARTFLRVTLPGVRFAVISAAFVVFILAFTDFGVPKVVGGNYNVLATDIYKQVIGQQDFSMGATISIVLLAPTILAFALDRLTQRRQAAAVTSRAVFLRPKRRPVTDWVAFAYCSLVSAAILLVVGTVVFASFVDVWPYKLEFSLRHYDFSRTGGGGWGSFWNSLKMSMWSAAIGAAIVVVAAYLIEKSRTWSGLRGASYFLAMVPIALPGMVIGLSFVFFFNPTHFQIGAWQVRNPFSWLYGTMAILVLANTIHFLTVSFMTALTSLKQIDREFESVAASLRVPFWRMAWQVTLPLSLPAVLEIFMYIFVNSMVTVSAVIFLYSANLKLASVAIVNMDDAGNTASAAAMSVLVIVACLAARGLHTVVSRYLVRRTQLWRGA